VLSHNLRTPRLTRFGSTKLEHVPARRIVPEIMVECDDAVDLGAGEIESGGDQGDAVLWNATERILKGPQHRQSGTGPMLMLLD
jgi:hypothetical protein